MRKGKMSGKGRKIIEKNSNKENVMRMGEGES